MKSSGLVRYSKCSNPEGYSFITSGQASTITVSKIELISIFVLTEDEWAISAARGTRKFVSRSCTLVFIARPQFFGRSSQSQLRLYALSRRRQRFLGQRHNHPGLARYLQLAADILIIQFREARGR